VSARRVGLQKIKLAARPENELINYTALATRSDQLAVFNDHLVAGWRFKNLIKLTFSFNLFAPQTIPCTQPPLVN
jgi:hypothetical protein